MKTGKRSVAAHVTEMHQTSRQVAFLALRSINRGAFADVALDRSLQQANLSALDRRLVTELVYGSVRRQRTLDALIDQLAAKASQPPDLRLLIRLGLYQLRYLSHIPASAAVDTTVQLVKHNGFKGLAGFVNGLLRQYDRLQAQTADPLLLPSDPIERLGTQYSYPDWIIQMWVEDFGATAAEQLCDWFNRAPHIDLRINPLQTSIEQVEAAMQVAGVAVSRLPLQALPQALRLPQGAGAIQSLPGFQAGEWTVQDSSAQLVGYLLDPQPGELVIDACAAPGGKATHLAELMQDRGKIWACDRAASRLKKVVENARRLQLNIIEIFPQDSRQGKFMQLADRVLLDAPCSGLGTLHRHADARWRQTPESVQALIQLQAELLAQAATWVKPGGFLVYATCTLNSQENEAIVTSFLAQHTHWHLCTPNLDSPIATLMAPQGWLKVLPHQRDMDGFFMARLQRLE